MKTDKSRGQHLPATPEEKAIIESLKDKYKLGYIAKAVGRSRSFVWNILHPKEETNDSFFDVDRFVKESWYLNISEKKVN